MEINEIVSSLSAPALIKDPVIKNATFYHLPTGGFEMYSGGFTVVFPCKVNGEKWAFRCWTNDLGNVKERYVKFSADMKESKLPYFCDFTYEDVGICVNGRLYPTTRMKWVEGLTIKDYIVEHKDDKNILDVLAHKFKMMCEGLHKCHFAHGDLQHGNILVGKDNNIYLVDYDSFFTPSLKGVADIVHGIPDYQHPKRKNNLIANEKLDFFSELIIYISILAVAEKPSFADEYQLKDAERLLFSREDYANIQVSKVYQELFSLGGIFPILLKILVDYLAKNDINELEPFEDLLVKYYKEPIIKAFGFDEGTTLVVGEHSTLRWNVENASEIYINGQYISPSCKTYEVGNDIVGSRTFTLLIVNGIKQKSASVNIEVVNRATIEFSSNKNRLKQGREGEVVLSWNIQHAKKAVLRYGNYEEPVALKGKRTVDCQMSTVFEIDAVNLDGRTHTRRTIEIQVCKECNIVFKADKTFTLPSVPVKLSWKVTGGNDILLNGESVGLEGYKEVFPTKDTEYVLSAQDPFGQTSKNITVRMLPIPVMKSILVPTPKIEKEITIEDNIPRINVEVSVDNFVAVPELNRLSYYPELNTITAKLATIEPKFIKLDSHSGLDKGLKLKYSFGINLIKSIKKIIAKIRNK